ncbi:transposase [Acetobacter aceti]
MSHVDGHHVLNGLAYMIWNGLQWKDARKAYGRRRTLYNRFSR